MNLAFGCKKTEETTMGKSGSFRMQGVDSRGSFRMQRVDSLMMVGRCNSSILLSESISEDCDRIATYERLSQSMRFNDKELSPGLASKKKKQGWVRINWLFFKPGHGGLNDKIKEDAAAAKGSDKSEEKKKQKRRSSWLPDPDRRWPVQGW